MREITVKAPATIANFGPGFDIFALALDKPFDEFRVYLTQNNSVTINIEGDKGEIPNEASSNTAGVAAINFLKRKRLSQGIGIDIKKGIKSCCGLGSSGASAVATTYCLNHLFSANLSKNDMIDIASDAERVTGGEPHADNAAASLLGGFVLVRNFIPVDVVRFEVPEIPLVIAVIKKKFLTTRGLIKKNYTLDEVKRQMSCCSSIIHAVACGELKDIGRFVNTDCLSEPARSSTIPGYGSLKRKILDAGAYGCNICGGGSSIFAICEYNKGDEIAEVFSRELKGIGEKLIKTKSSNIGITKI